MVSVPWRPVEEWATVGLGYHREAQYQHLREGLGRVVMELVVGLLTGSLDPKDRWCHFDGLSGQPSGPSLIEL